MANLVLLVPGQTVYLTPEAFNSRPQLKSKITSTLAMTVVSTGYIRVGKRRAHWTYLESPETGKIGFSTWRLYGKTYLNPDFASQAPFEIGEYVEFGDLSRTVQKFPILERAKDDWTLTGNPGHSTYLGKFVKVYDLSHYVISARVPGGRVYKLIVPIDEVKGLNSGKQDHFEKAIQPLLGLRLQFATGEKIRFRDESNVIATGQFQSWVDDRTAEVKTVTGAILSVPRSRVFRFIGGEPHTEMYREDFVADVTDTPIGNFRDFLDAAGILTSLPDFVSMSDSAKFRTLAEYLMANVDWTAGAYQAEMAGVSSYHDILCTGAGICRHLAPMLATLLSEAGFAPRVTWAMVTDPKTGQDSGHAWVEVEGLDSFGQYKTYIVDNSGAVVGEDMAEALRKSGANRDSIEARFYTLPTRSYANLKH